MVQVGSPQLPGYGAGAAKPPGWQDSPYQNYPGNGNGGNGGNGSGAVSVVWRLVFVRITNDRKYMVFEYDPDLVTVKLEKLPQLGLRAERAGVMLTFSKQDGK